MVLRQQIGLWVVFVIAATGIARAEVPWDIVDERSLAQHLAEYSPRLGVGYGFKFEVAGWNWRHSFESFDGHILVGQNPPVSLLGGQLQDLIRMAGAKLRKAGTAAMIKEATIHRYKNSAVVELGDDQWRSTYTYEGPKRHKQFSGMVPVQMYVTGFTPWAWEKLGGRVVVPRRAATPRHHRASQRGAYPSFIVRPETLPHRPRRDARPWVP